MNKANSRQFDVVVRDPVVSMDVAEICSNVIPVSHVRLHRAVGELRFDYKNLRNRVVVVSAAWSELSRAPNFPQLVDVAKSGGHVIVITTEVVIEPLPNNICVLPVPFSRRMLLDALEASTANAA